MSRPGPLQDMPVARFLSSGISPSMKTPIIAKPAKRPLSPSKSTIFSPAKRRILRSEGIPLPGEASSSSLRSQLPSSGSDIFGATRTRSMALTPPLQRTGVGEGSSRDRRTSRRPSPKLLGDDSAPAVSLHRSSRVQSSQPEASTPPIAILREMPLPHDRQAVHYPGFDTFQDTHIFLVAPRRASPSFDNEESWSSSEGVFSEREISKENIPPWKKAKKSSLTRSSLPTDKSLRFDRYGTREGVQQLHGVTASSWCIGGVVIPQASSTELPTVTTPN